MNTKQQPANRQKIQVESRCRIFACKENKIRRPIRTALFHVHWLCYMLYLHSLKLQCVICARVLANSSLKPSLHRSLSMNATQVDKAADFFKRKLAMENWNSLSCIKPSDMHASALEASY
jgi:hypothetical protein